MPATGCFFPTPTENLPRNMLFWSLLATVTTSLIGSYGGYRPQALSKHNQSARRAAVCYIAASTAMLAVAFVLGHAEAVSRFWTARSPSANPATARSSSASTNRRTASPKPSQPTTSRPTFPASSISPPAASPVRPATGR